jgi:hypothetical protein
MGNGKLVPGRMNEESGLRTEAVQECRMVLDDFQNDAFH